MNASNNAKPEACPKETRQTRRKIIVLNTLYSQNGTEIANRNNN